MIIICGCRNSKIDCPPPYYESNKSDTPIEFANGEIETTNGISFTKDGHCLYTSMPIEEKFTNGRNFAAIFKRDYKDGKWSNPKLVDFEIKLDAYHPVLSYDNQTMLFHSRSHPDTVNLSIPHNIWYSTRKKKGWSVPKMIKAVNSQSYDSYPTIAKNRNLYFNSDRPGGKGGMDIYMSKFTNGKYQEPVNIEILNSINVENDLTVDPKERFIIFNRYVSETMEIDLFISHKTGNEWQEPIELDVINQQDEWELTPTLSPDGKYFFYELNRKIMQIELDKLYKFK